MIDNEYKNYFTIKLLLTKSKNECLDESEWIPLVSHHNFIFSVSSEASKIPWHSTVIGLNSLQINTVSISLLPSTFVKLKSEIFVC